MTQSQSSEAPDQKSNKDLPVNDSKSSANVIDFRAWVGKALQNSWWVGFVMAIIILLAILAVARWNESANANVFRLFDVNSPTSVSVDATQRAIVSTVRLEEIEGASEPSRRIVVCAEPSPDALSSAAASLAMSASAEKGGNVPGGVEQELLSAIDTTVSQLGTRGDTIQLLRDGLFRACEAYQNGALDSIEYSLLSTKYANIMLTMLAIDKLTMADAGGKSSEEANESVSAIVRLMVNQIVLEQTGNVISRRCLVAVTKGIHAKLDPKVKEFCLQHLSEAVVRDREAERRLSMAWPFGPQAIEPPEPEEIEGTLDLDGDELTVTVNSSELAWIELSLDSDSDIILTARASQSALVDPEIMLFSGDSVIGQNDDVGNELEQFALGLESTDSLLSAALEAGSYQIGAKSLRHGQVGPVQLQARSRESVDFENLLVKEASELEVGGGWEAELLNQSGVLRFVLALKEDHTYRMLAKSSVDVKFRLAYLGGTHPLVVASIDDSGDSYPQLPSSTDAGLDFRPEQGGTYLLFVDSVGERPGQIMVRVDEVEPE